MPLQPRRARHVRAALLVLCAIPATAAAQAPPASVFEARLGEADAATPDLSVRELERILAAGGAVLLDTRPQLEYALGHLPGALNVAPKPGMPMSEYTSDVAEVGRLVGGDRSRTIVLYCNGPFCGKGRRVAADLVAAGYRDVRRFQLGAPVWRALGRVMVIEPEGVRHVFRNDRTAWLVDAREPDRRAASPVAGASHVGAGEVHAAKDDGRLPMHDHNARIVVFGSDAAQARALAEELTANAFHNVAYFEGTPDALRRALMGDPAPTPRVVRSADVAAPATGGLTQETVHESEAMVSRIMRLAPGAPVAEHHHPFFEETFVVQRGTVRLTLDDRVHELGAGDVVYIPAGTVIAGTNGGGEEAVVVVTWANTGRAGPLTVPGRPAGHH